MAHRDENLRSAFRLVPTFENFEPTRMTHSSPCDFAATHLRFGSNMVPICSLGIGDAEHCPGRPGRDSMEVLPGDSVKAPEGSYQKK